MNPARVALAGLIVPLVILAAASPAPAQKEPAGKAPEKATEGRSPRPRHVYGRVVKVNGRDIVVDSGGVRRLKLETVTTDEHTRVFVAGKPATLADLRNGMSVRVTPRRANNGRPAHLEVHARPAALSGRVVRVDGATLVLTTRNERGRRVEVTVTTDEKTTVHLAGGPGRLQDLKPDTLVLVRPDTGTAQDVREVVDAGPPNDGAPRPRPLPGVPVPDEPGRGQ